MKRLAMGVLMLGWALGGLNAEAAQVGAGLNRSAFDFGFEAIDGSAMPLSAYKGKVLLVVNTASECGFTPQYEGLEMLWQEYKDEGLVVIAVPSNDFGGQEPGSNMDIKNFCESRYRITFPMTGKTVVKGEAAAPFYRFAKAALEGSGAPGWNFHKYLIGRDGRVVDYYTSMTKPTSGSLKAAIETELAKL